jgi:hypothetical protein
MKPPFIDSVRDATVENLSEYRLILGIVALFSVMAVILVAPNLIAYFSALEALLP